LAQFGHCPAQKFGFARAGAADQVGHKDAVPDEIGSQVLGQLVIFAENFFANIENTELGHSVSLTIYKHNFSKRRIQARAKDGS
jgi:hypothetical protein